MPKLNCSPWLTAASFSLFYLYYFYCFCFCLATDENQNCVPHRWPPSAHKVKPTLRIRTAGARSPPAHLIILVTITSRHMRDLLHRLLPYWTYHTDSFKLHPHQVHSTASPWPYRWPKHATDSWASTLRWSTPCNYPGSRPKHRKGKRDLHFWASSKSVGAAARVPPSLYKVLQQLYIGADGNSIELQSACSRSSEWCNWIRQQPAFPLPTVALHCNA